VFILQKVAYRIYWGNEQKSKNKKDLEKCLRMLMLWIQKL
jgi:hypothetical protein